MRRFISALYPAALSVSSTARVDSANLAQQSSERQRWPAQSSNLQARPAQACACPDRLISAV